MRRRRSAWNGDVYELSAGEPTAAYEGQEEAAWDDELETEGDGEEGEDEDW